MEPDKTQTGRNLKDQIKNGYIKPIKLDSSQGFEDLQLQFDSAGNKTIFGQPKTVEQRVDDYNGMGSGRIIIKGKTNTPEGVYFYPDNTEANRKTALDLYRAQTIFNLPTILAPLITAGKALGGKYFIIPPKTKQTSMQNVTPARPGLKESLIRAIEPQGKYPKGDNPYLPITDFDQGSILGMDGQDYSLASVGGDTYHLTNFDDTEILFTTPDPKSFKKSDVISWDKSKILKQEQKLKANERAREQAYQIALQQAGGDRSKISRKVYEQYAGAINISEVEEVAKRTGHNVADVVKYIEHNEYQLKQLNAARTLLNDWARRDTVDTMRATIAKYANDKKIVDSKEYKNYVKLAKSLDNATSGVWTKGHKDAIKAVFMRGEFGGNRISNLMLEEGIDSIFTDATTGNLRIKKGNIAKQDRPVDKYTLVNLAGVSWDLTDDFLKVVNPRSVLVDMDEGLQKFGDQYTDIALNAYDKLIAEFLQANSIKLNSRKAKIASRAITDGLVAWFKLFDSMQNSGVKDLKSKLKLPISIDNAKDYWFRNENTIGKRTQKRKSDPDESYEVDLLEREFIKAFKRIWDNTK